MFGRRIFASSPIPRQMWAKLHIQSSSQCARQLPALASVLKVYHAESNVALKALAEAPSFAAKESLADLEQFASLLGSLALWGHMTPCVMQHLSFPSFTRVTKVGQSF